MVFDLDRQALFTLRIGNALRHGPAIQGPVKLHAEIVMQTRSRMFLDYKAMPVGLRSALAPGLGSLLKVALLPAFFERHNHDECQAAFFKGFGRDLRWASRMLCGSTETRSITLAAFRLGLARSHPVKFDVGIARGPWGEVPFFEAAGASLFLSLHDGRA